MQYCLIFLSRTPPSSSLRAHSPDLFLPPSDLSLLVQYCLIFFSRIPSSSSLRAHSVLPLVSLLQSHPLHHWSFMSLILRSLGVASVHTGSVPCLSNCTTTENENSNTQGHVSSWPVLRFMALHYVVVKVLSRSSYGSHDSKFNYSLLYGYNTILSSY